MTNSLAPQLTAHWQDIRGRTYDLLDLLTEADLDKKLPFAASQSIGNQFYCMLGTQESWGPLLTNGKMAGWSCSLNGVPHEARGSYLDQYKQRLRAADDVLITTLASVDWNKQFADGSTPLAQYLRLVEHEAHHHGQLINFIYALNLPIPQSWAEQWALTRNE